MLHSECRSLVQENDNFLSFEPETKAFFENNEEIDNKIKQLDRNLHGQEIERLENLKNLNRGPEFALVQEG